MKRRRSVPNTKRAATRPTGTRAARTGSVRTMPASTRGRINGPRPIELYFWPTPNGWKISIMLEECRLPYVVRPVDISKGEQFAPEFLAISPNNRMPAIVDPDGPGRRPISVFESGAILQYLGRKTGKFYPARGTGAGRGGGVAVLANGRARSDGRPGQPLSPLRAKADRLRDRALHRRGQSAVGRHEQTACRPTFLAGRYSIADMACVGWVRLADRMGQDLKQFLHLKRWFEAIRARPAVQRGMGIRVEAASAVDMTDPKVRAVLFGQRAT